MSVIIPPSQLGPYIDAAIERCSCEWEYTAADDEDVDDDGMMHTECECCGKQHSYPAVGSSGYYDLCRTCAVEHGYEDADDDWRLHKESQE